ncbi:ABC transporter substrate-binding protein [Leptolyngbya sp. 15MV]|nr:ABC transporter substrate-binding protein [Leptolyngbya sp. 15MV]
MPSLTASRRALLLGAAAMAAPRVAGAQPAPVRLGILQPVTGALAQDGEYGRLGAELAIQEINSTGGLRALGGAQIQMVFGDARSNPEGGNAEVERMQAEGVVAIVGGFASPICLAASQTASRYDLPYVVDVGVSDQIVTRGLRNTFRFGPGFGKVTAGALDNLVALNDAAGKPARTVVVVHEDGLFGSGMARLMNTELPKRGFEVLETISHPTPARDMSNIALRIRALNPDLIIPSSYYAEFVLLSQTLQQRRIRPKGIYCVLNGAEAVASSAGPCAAAKASTSATFAPVPPATATPSVSSRKIFAFAMASGERSPNRTRAACSAKACAMSWLMPPSPPVPARALRRRARSASASRTRRPACCAHAA